MFLGVGTKMKLLVTGGAGFIGSHLLQLISLRDDIEAVVLDNLSSGRIEHIPGNIRLIKKDIREKDLSEIFAEEKFDKVIHLAAQTMVPYSLNHPQEDCDVNLMGMINLLECCRKYHVQNIVFSSSAAVYGDNSHIPLKETEKTVPTSFYGLTKMAGEHYLKLYHNLYGLNATVLRFANVYGERQGCDGEGGVIGIFCNLLAQNKDVTVFGNGEQTRDFVYAGDVASALLRAVFLTGFQVINIATKKETSINQLLVAFRSATNRDFAVSYQEARTGDIFRSVLDNDNCLKYLKMVPQMTVQEGVKRTYADYVKRFGGC